MFVRSYLEFDWPCEAVVTLLLGDDPGRWLVAIVEESARWEGELVSRVGFEAAHRWVGRRDGIAIGPSVPFGGGLLLPVSWRSTEPRALFPMVEADLQVAPLGRDLTQLSVNARYEPSPSGPGMGLDRTLLHRVAEAVIGDLLRRVASALRSRLEDRAGT